MIGGYPLTWLVSELLGTVLFCVCAIHAARGDDPARGILELFGFILGAAIFENVGVLVYGRYFYAHHLMMVGVVPLAVLFLEASILYSAMILIKYLKLPGWSVLFVAGFLCSVQDLTIDLAYALDVYTIGGEPLGQWNWRDVYDHSFFGIPYFNFSGWMYMTGLYAGWVTLGRRLCGVGGLGGRSGNGERRGRSGQGGRSGPRGNAGKRGLHGRRGQRAARVFGYAYPFLSGILVIVTLAIPGISWVITFKPNTFVIELSLLAANYFFAMVLLFVFRKRRLAVDWKRDRIAILIPVALHLYDFIIITARGIHQAVIPCVVVTILHCAWLYGMCRAPRGERSRVRRAGQVGREAGQVGREG